VRASQWLVISWSPSADGGSGVYLSVFQCLPPFCVVGLVACSPTADDCVRAGAPATDSRSPSCIGTRTPAADGGGLCMGVYFWSPSSRDLARFLACAPPADGCGVCIYNLCVVRSRVIKAYGQHTWKWGSEHRNSDHKSGEYDGRAHDEVVYGGWLGFEEPEE
jgi:hypothetical protein